MRDGYDNEIDCTTVVEEMYTFLDGELTEARRTVITRHLHLCVDCHEVVDFHAQLKLTISERCREQVPDSLRARVLRSLGGNDRRAFGGNDARLFGGNDAGPGMSGQ